MEKLDELESVGTLYDRTTVTVELTGKDYDNECIEANVYVIKNFRPNLLELPFISSYTEEHAKKYIPKGERYKGNTIKMLKNV